MVVIGSVIILGLGVWALIVTRNLFKKVLALNIIGSAVVLFFIGLGYRKGGSAPILDSSSRSIVDPVPQALMLTAIVVSLCMTALALVLIIHIFGHEGTLDEKEISEKLKDG